MDLALITYSGWCAIKPNQTKPALEVCGVWSSPAWPLHPGPGSIYGSNRSVQKLFIFDMTLCKKTVCLEATTQKNENMKL